MYKIGTGEKGTIPGKIYLFTHCERDVPGYWVYCKGKLYLRRNGESSGLVTVINSETFVRTEVIELSCKTAFSESKAANFNKNFPLLSDGESIFTVVVTFDRVKMKLRDELQEDYKKAKAKKEKEKKVDARQQDYANICEFHLIEFDINKDEMTNDKPIEFFEKGLVDELFEGFSGYFSQKECLKALRLYSNNIEEASKWLLNEGEKQRIKTTVKTKRRLLLGQSVIQEGRDTDVVENSILSPSVISNGQWTMTDSQITVYLYNTVAKIFSIKETNLRNLADKGTKPYGFSTEEVAEKTQVPNEANLTSYFEPIELKGTYMQTVTTECLDYNRYIVTYGIESHKFYILSLDNSSILTLLEYGDFSSYNDMSIPRQVRFSIDKPCTSPIELALLLCEFLKECEKHRYCLPWKWDSWATLYKKICDQIKTRLSNSGLSEVEEKKLTAKLVKVKKRANQFIEIQHNELIKTLEKRPLTKGGVRSLVYSKQSKEDACQDKKEPMTIKENVKEFAFCTVSSWNSLETLLRLVKDKSSALIAYLYYQLFVWNKHCGIFCNYAKIGRQDLIKELLSLLLSIIKGETIYPEHNDLIKSYAWRILAVNWTTMVTNAELQSFLFQEAIKYNYESIDDGSFYEILSNLRSSPFELLCCRYCMTLPVFFPDHAVRQTGIQSYKLVNTSTEKKPKYEFIEIANSTTCEIIERYRIEEWVPKLGALAHYTCEEIENLSLFGSDISIEERIRYYSADIPIEGNKEELLERLRREQNARVDQNWKLIEQMLVSDMSKHSLLSWTFYNQLVLNAMSYGSLSNNLEFTTKLLSATSSLITRVKELTADYSNIKSEQIPWISKFIEHLFWVGNFCYAIDNNQNMAMKLVQPLIELVSKMTEFTRLIETDSFRKSHEIEKSERINYAKSKVFETVHPYGRRESNRKEMYNFPNAVAIQCEIDNRSQSENSNDSLLIYTNDDTSNLNYLCKSQKFSGKCDHIDPIVVPGSSVHVDFQVNSQTQKMDPSLRWGFRVTLKPIYGQSTMKELVKGEINEWDGKFSYQMLNTLTSATRFITMYSAKLIRSLIKGINLIPEETECREFFQLPLVKTGLKFVKKPSLLPKTKEKNGKRKYVLHKKVVDPIVLKIIEDSEQGKGYLVELLAVIRKAVKEPDSYDIEKKRESFNKKYINQWEHAERLCALALLYHMGYTITDKEAKIDDEGIQIIGQSLNDILRWMLKQLIGVKEYYQLKLSFLEVCSNCHTKLREKIIQEREMKEKEGKKIVEDKKEKAKRHEKVVIANSRARRKKVIPLVQKQVEAPTMKEEKKEPAVKISELSAERKIELNNEMSNQVNDMFSQRCQGNTDLVKNLAEILKIAYNPKEQSEILRKIFNKLKDSLKDIINFESPEKLPDEIPLIPLNAKNPYEIVVKQVLSRVSFLFELNNSARKEKVLEKIISIKNPPMKSIAEEADPFAELLLIRTPSMQPFLQGEQTPTQAKKAVDDYLKWKHSKIPGEQSFPTTMERAVVAVITANYSAKELRKALKLKEKRGMIRESGLKYLMELTKNHTPSEITVGSIARTVENGPFSQIEGCSMEVTRSIVELCMRLCSELIRSIDSELTAYTKIVHDNVDKSLRVACNHMKEILDMLIDFIVLIKEQDKNNILALLCENSSSVDLTTFLAKLIALTVTMDAYLVKFKYDAVFATLREHLRKVCLVILGKFMVFVAEKAVSPIMDGILEEILKCLEGDSKNDVTILDLLYESLLLFGEKNINARIEEKCAKLLIQMLESSSTPCILKRVSKCCQLLLKNLPAEELTKRIVQRIGTISLLQNSPLVERKISEEKKYYLILHLNAKEENPLFLLNALYHLENVKPSFSDRYQQESKGTNKRRHRQVVKGPFDQTPLFIEGLDKFPTLGSTQRFSSFNNINQRFEEIVKVTYSAPKTEDSEEEKQRKVNEKNFNKRMSQHFSDAKVLSRVLFAQSFVQYPIPQTHAEALELATIFEKAYNGQLEPIPINPHMTEEAKKRKLKDGSTVESSYPLTVKHPKNVVENTPPPIIIAKERLVMSLCEEQLFMSYFKVNSKSKYLKRMKFIPIETAEPVIGSSCSLCIDEYVNLLHKVFSDKRFNGAIDRLVKQALVNLETKSWNKLNNENQEIIMGSLIFISGWFKCIRPGCIVDAMVNDANEECIVIYGGFGSGSEKVGVVVKNDKTLTIHSIPLDCVRPKADKLLRGLVDEKTILRILLKVSEELRKEADNVTKGIIRVLLLKMAVEIAWKDNSKDEKRLLEMLMELTKNNSSEIIKRSGEESVVELWEKLVEKVNPSNDLFYVLTPQKSSGDEKKESVAGIVDELKSVFEYVQPVSSYSRSLPDQNANAHSAIDNALKLLDHWEKYIIPPMQDMVKGAYKPWENLYYFEQLRDRLRKNDIGKAMEDALVICDQHLPNNSVLPKDNRDWSAFVNEECIAGTWANARIVVRKFSSNPIMARLMNRKLNEIPVIIRAADWRIQAAFCEYTDPEVKRKLNFLVPIDLLKEQRRPLSRSASVYSYSELLTMYRQNLKDLTANLALRTFMAMYQSCPLSAVNLIDVVHWIVLDELKDDSVEGWVRHTQPILQPKSQKKQNDGGLIARVMKAVNSLNFAQTSKIGLVKLEDQIQKLDAAQLNTLNNWCIETWKKLANEENLVSLNLTQASKAFESDTTLCQGNDGGVIFPLNKQISHKEDYGACVITFELSATLSPNSKLKFYSDPLGHCLVAQINAGKTSIESITPIVINYGKVWCHFHQGTTANLTVEEKENTKPSCVPCCVAFIPAVWTTVSWLSDVLTTIMLQKEDISTIDTFYKPLIANICNFTHMPHIPNILKQLVFVLLNRVLRKVRYIYNVCPWVEGDCLGKLGLTKEWLKDLIVEIDKLRDCEDGGEESTYSEYIQNSTELIASALLPFKNAGETSIQAIMEQINLPDWIKALLNVAVFLNYFRKEGELSKELIDDIFINMNLKNQEDNVMIIENLPSKLSSSEIKKKLVGIFKSQKVRIVNQETDIIVIEEDIKLAVVVMDGFDLGYEEVDDSKNEPEIKAEEETKEEKEKEEEVLPSWICISCTFTNIQAAETCEMCGTLRPPPMVEEAKVDNEKPAKESPNKYEHDMWEKLIEKLKEIDTIPEEVTSDKEKKIESKKEEAKKTSHKESEKKTEEKIEEAKSNRRRHIRKEANKIENKNAEVKPKDNPEAKQEVAEAPNKPESLIKVKRGSDLFKPKLDKHLVKVFTNRLFDATKQEFLLQVKTVIVKIYEKMKLLMKETNLVPLVPEANSVYVSAGLNERKTEFEDIEVFTKAIYTVAQADPWLVWELFAHYGYDLWLDKCGYMSLQELPKIFSTALLEDMIAMCEVEICKETKLIMQLATNHLRFAPVDADPLVILNGFDETRLRMRYHNVLTYGLDELRYNWAILKKFNDCLIKAIPYINWNMCVSLIPEGSVTLNVSSFLSSFRKLCFSYIKRQLQQAVFDKTAVVREKPPRMSFERFRFNPNKKEAFDNVKSTMFYKAYEQMKKINLTELRPQKPVGSAPFLAFELLFKGEYVVGEGGPYRQFFTDVSAELQPSATNPEVLSNTLHLLCPTPNTINKQGEAKDKFTLCPSEKSTTSLLLYEFLGLLMGCCMRTGVRLTLNLPSIVWKQVVQEPLSLSDLEEVDTSVVGMLQYITQVNLTAEEFESVFTENFTAMLSDTSTVNLLPDGVNVPVTFERREEYAELLLKARLNESQVQCRAIRKGISLVVPEAMLNFFTNQEIACLICGRPSIDIKMLKRHTRYSKGLGEESARVKFFWEVLEEMNETDKLRLIRFCWGQERLPANDDEYERKQVRFMIKPAMRRDVRNEENALPKADTCFFNLELPNYKTKEKLREKVMAAIYTDFVSMNAEDNRLNPESSDSRLLDDAN